MALGHWSVAAASEGAFVLWLQCCCPGLYGPRAHSVAPLPHVLHPPTKHSKSYSSHLCCPVLSVPCRITFEKENVRDLSTPSTVTTKQGEDIAIGTTFVPTHMQVCWGCFCGQRGRRESGKHARAHVCEKGSSNCREDFRRCCTEWCGVCARQLAWRAAAHLRED